MKYFFVLCFITLCTSITSLTDRGADTAFITYLLYLRPDGLGKPQFTVDEVTYKVLVGDDEYEYKADLTRKGTHYKDCPIELRYTDEKKYYYFLDINCDGEEATFTEFYNAAQVQERLHYITSLVSYSEAVKLENGS